MAAPKKVPRHVRAFNCALGERIKAQRLEYMYVRADLASELGVTVEYIECIENGASTLTVFQLNTICELFRLDIDSMLFEAREARDAVGG